MKKFDFSKKRNYKEAIIFYIVVTLASLALVIGLNILLQTQEIKSEIILLSDILFYLIITFYLLKSIFFQKTCCLFLIKIPSSLV